MAQKNYNPLKDAVYMSPQMKEFFKDKLHQELAKLEEEISNTVSADAEDNQPHPDFLDQGSSESLHQVSRAFYQHEKLLVRQTELALRRLACGTYGYCVVTGDPIGVPRLIAAPHTPYSLDVQESKEHSAHSF